MAVWALVLARRTGQTDLTFGAVTSGRALVDMPHVEKVVGPCCQLSPIRVRLDDGRRQTAMDLLQSVQRQAVESAAYNLIGFRGPPPKKNTIEIVGRRARRISIRWLIARTGTLRTRWPLVVVEMVGGNNKLGWRLRLGTGMLRIRSRWFRLCGEGRSMWASWEARRGGCL